MRDSCTDKDVQKLMPLVFKSQVENFLITNRKCKINLQLGEEKSEMIKAALFQHFIGSVGKVLGQI